MVNESQQQGMDDSTLDRALEAAFDPTPAGAPRRGNGAGGATASVLERIERRHGVRSRISLAEPREEGDETIVLPPAGSRESEAAPASPRYQVFGEIARGGMGVIYRGRDADLGRDVAIKVLQPAFMHEAPMVQRFVEEAQIAGQLQHPGILPVYELGLQDDARPFFSMKLIKGRTLEDLLSERSEAEADRARLLKVFEQVCQTVAYAQARGVVHRDLKPSNVMVGAFGEVQVVDWGLAKVLRHGDRADTTGTVASRVETVRSHEPGSGSLAGSVMGTPGYMAPEQARGAVDEIDERTDVHALGAMLFQILTGAPPGGAESASGAGPARHAEDQIGRRLAATGADPELLELTRRCLAGDRAARPRNAKVVADAVSGYLASLEAKAHEADVRAAEQRTRAEAERHRRRLTLALASITLAATLIIAVGVAWAYVASRQRAELAMTRLAAAVSETSETLGAAAGARLDNDEAWNALHAAAERVEAMLAGVPADSTLAVRARALLEGIEVRARRRRLAATVENVVIHGATHYDAESWRAMERDLRAVLLEFGIDLENMPRDEIARRIREDEATFELADGLELWLGTVGSLISMGAMEMELAEFRAWLDTLLAADPDPLRRRVRELVYAAIFREPVDREEVTRLFDSLDFEDVHPRTLSWLSTIYYVVGDADAMVEVLRRITRAHPGDFMLLFDAGFQCLKLERFETAIRYLLRCVSIRPDVAGIWRQLGLAYRGNGELIPALEALDESIELDPEHGPTYVDRAETHLARGEHEAAVTDAEAARRLSDTADARAWFVIGRARFAQRQYAAACAAFEQTAAAGAAPDLAAEVEQWQQRCRAQLDAGGDNP